MIEAALVISLKRNEFGRMRLFKSRYKFSMPLHVIEGIDGLAVENKSTMPSGTYGCLLSHIKTLQFAKDNNFSSVLILEDDVRFADNFEQHLEDSMKELPDNWDCLWLGGFDQEKPQKYSQRLNKLVSCWGAYSYIVRNTMYDFWIEKLSELSLPCDNHYMTHQKNFNSFKTVRPLVLHSHISSVRINADKGIAI